MSYFFSSEEIFDNLFFSFFKKTLSSPDRDLKVLWKQFFIQLESYILPQELSKNPIGNGRIDLELHRYRIETACLRKKFFDSNYSANWISYPEKTEKINILTKKDLRFAMIERISFIMIKYFLDSYFRKESIQFNLFNLGCIKFSKDCKFYIDIKKLNGIKKLIESESSLRSLEDNEKQLLACIAFYESKGDLNRIDDIAESLQSELEERIDSPLARAFNIFRNMNDVDDELIFMETEDSIQTIEEPKFYNQEFHFKTDYKNYFQNFLEKTVTELLNLLAIPHSNFACRKIEESKIFETLGIKDLEVEESKCILKSFSESYGVSSFSILKALKLLREFVPDLGLPINILKRLHREESNSRYDLHNSMRSFIFRVLKFNYQMVWSKSKSESFKISKAKLFKFALQNQKSFQVLINNHYLFECFLNDVDHNFKSSSFEEVVKLFQKGLENPDSFYGFFCKNQETIKNLIDLKGERELKLSTIKKFYLRDHSPNKEISSLTFSAELFMLYTSYVNLIISERYNDSNFIDSNFITMEGPEDVDAVIKYDLFLSLARKALTNQTALDCLRHLNEISGALELAIQSCSFDSLWIEEVIEAFNRDPEKTRKSISSKILSLIYDVTYEDNLQIGFSEDFFEKLYETESEFFDFIYSNADELDCMMERLRSFPKVVDGTMIRVKRDCGDCGYTFNFVNLVSQGLDIFKDTFNKRHQILQYLDEEYLKFRNELRKECPLFEEAFSKFVIAGKRDLETSQNNTGFTLSSSSSLDFIEI